MNRWTRIIGRPFEWHDVLVIPNPMFWMGLGLSWFASRFVK